MKNQWFYLVFVIIFVFHSKHQYYAQDISSIELQSIQEMNDNAWLHNIPRYHTIPVSNLWFCRSIECLHRFTRPPSSNSNLCPTRRIILAGLTYDTENDYMFPFFIPWLLHLFSDQVSSDITIFIIDYFLYGPDAGNYIINEMIQKLPECTVFLLFHCHALSTSFHPSYLVDYRKVYGYHKHILFHLSHEVAYDIDQEIPTHTCYGNESQVLDYYSKYDLVIKQYYYEPFHRHAIYIPLGPQDYYQIEEYRKLHNIQPIDSRKQLCTFSGRFSYQTRVPEHKERDDIKELMNRSKFPCLVIPSKDDVYGTPQLSHYQYITIMADSIFIPCAAGSAPETFRLYESLELGSIPILVRPRKIVNYLSQWKDYPGPILQSWRDLEKYFKFLSLIDEKGDQICQEEQEGGNEKDYFSLCSSLMFTEYFQKSIVYYNSYPYNITNTSSKELSKLHQYLNYLQYRIRSWYLQYKRQVARNIIERIHEIFSPTIL